MKYKKGEIVDYFGVKAKVKSARLFELDDNYEWITIILMEGDVKGLSMPVRVMELEKVRERKKSKKIEKQGKKPVNRATKRRV